METFNYTPDYSAKVSKKHDISRLVFGDGYSQRIGKGVKSLTEDWNITFQRGNDETEAINLFLEQRGGWESFLWTTPLGNTKKFVCEQWGVSEDSFNNRTISATFMEEL